MEKLIIYGRLDGLNELIAANRTNKYKGAQLKKDNEAAVMCAAALCGMKPINKYPVKAVFRWYEKDKRRDWDNVISAQKYVLDGLQKAHILEGDSQRYINAIEHYQSHDKNNPRIEVEFLENAVK